MLDICSMQPYVRSASMFKWCFNNKSHSVAYVHKLFYVKSGDGTVSIDGRVVRIREGTLMLFAPGTPYSLKNLDDSVPMRVICVSFDFTYAFRGTQAPVQPSLPENFDSGQTVGEVGDTLYGLPFCRDGFGLFEQELFEIYTSFIESRVYCEGRISAILKKVLTELAQLITAGDERGGQVVRRVVSYISENYMRDITNEDVARELGYHPYYLSGLIRQNTGMTLHKYIINYRVNRALTAVLGGDMPMSEIYWRCGFKTQSHFTACFKRTFGVTPSEYRRRQFI